MTLVNVKTIQQLHAQIALAGQITRVIVRSRRCTQIQIQTFEITLGHQLGRIITVLIVQYRVNLTIQHERFFAIDRQLPGVLGAALTQMRQIDVVLHFVGTHATGDIFQLGGLQTLNQIDLRHG